MRKLNTDKYHTVVGNRTVKSALHTAEREKYYIALNEQAFEVSRELYEAYYKGRRKEKYFTHDLKQEHTKVDKETGQNTVIPSREDSYERLLAAEMQFAKDAEDIEDIEDAAIRAVMLEKLNESLHTLTDEETLQQLDINLPLSHPNLTLTYHNRGGVMRVSGNFPQKICDINLT